MAPFFITQDETLYATERGPDMPVVEHRGSLFLAFVNSSVGGAALQGGSPLCGIQVASV